MTVDRDEELDEIRLDEIIAYEIKEIGPATKSATSLPLGELSWQGFERLVAEIVVNTEHVSPYLYGRRGQKQYGLDIYCRTSELGSIVYQVKHYDDFTASNLREAVKKYAEPPENRRFNAKKFVLVTSAPCDDTGVTDELDRLKDEYEHDLEIALWNKARVGEVLRSYPWVVAGIFGPPWSEEWCGWAPDLNDEAIIDPHAILSGDPTVRLKVDHHITSAAELSETSPIEAAKKIDIVASTLETNGFAGHAGSFRDRQRDFLEAGERYQDAFSVAWKSSLNKIRDGRYHPFGNVTHGLLKNKEHLTEPQIAAAHLLAMVSGWNERSYKTSEAYALLASAVEGNLEDIDLLYCMVLEQVIVDSDYLLDPDGPSSEITDLIDLAGQVNATDPVLKARIQCSIADLRLTQTSEVSDVEMVYRPLNDSADISYPQARSLIRSRFAYQLFTHGDNIQAKRIWELALFHACQMQLHGDAQQTISSISAICNDMGKWPEDLQQMSDLIPNGNRLIGDNPDSLHISAHRLNDDKLPDALAFARQAHYEARISGHFQAEQVACSLLADVLTKSGEYHAALDHCPLAGDSKKAEILVKEVAEIHPAAHWLNNKTRVRSAAALQIIAGQSHLYTQELADQIKDQLFEYANVFRPQAGPELQAIQTIAALRWFFIDDALALVLETEWTKAGFPSLVRSLLRIVITGYIERPQLRGSIIPFFIRHLRVNPAEAVRQLSQIPEEHRIELTQELSKPEHETKAAVLEIFASWSQATEAVQTEARKRCAKILREPVDVPSNSISAGSLIVQHMQFLEALCCTEEPADISASLLLSDGSEPDDAAKTATLEPSDLRSLIADKLLAIAKDPNKGHPYRTEVLSALSRIVETETTEKRWDFAQQIYDLSREPQGSMFDSHHESSRHALSRSKVFIGENLVSTAVWVAAKSLPRGDLDESNRYLVQQVGYAATQLLISPNRRDQEDGTWALKEISDKFPGEHPAVSIPLAHPEKKIRATAARSLP